MEEHWQLCDKEIFKTHQKWWTSVTPPSLLKCPCPKNMPQPSLESYKCHQPGIEATLACTGAADLLGLEPVTTLLGVTFFLLVELLGSSLNFTMDLRFGGLS